MRRFSAIYLVLAAGCFPYRETWRPAVDGVVLDRDAHPIANARVEACSASRWNPSQCRARAAVLADGDGRFRLKPHLEWEWCCLGEAPMPFTVLAACADDGRAGGARVYGRGPADEGPLRVTVGARVSADEKWWVSRACGLR